MKRLVNVRGPADRLDGLAKALKYKVSVEELQTVIESLDEIRGRFQRCLQRGNALHALLDECYAGVPEEVAQSARSLEEYFLNLDTAFIRKRGIQGYVNSDGYLYKLCGTVTLLEDAVRQAIEEGENSLKEPVVRETEQRLNEVATLYGTQQPHGDASTLQTLADNVEHVVAMLFQLVKGKKNIDVQDELGARESKAELLSNEFSMKLDILKVLFDLSPDLAAQEAMNLLESLKLPPEEQTPEQQKELSKFKVAVIRLIGEHAGRLSLKT